MTLILKKTLNQIGDSLDWVYKWKELKCEVEYHEKFKFNKN